MVDFGKSVNSQNRSNLLSRVTAYSFVYVPDFCLLALGFALYGSLDGGSSSARVSDPVRFFQIFCGRNLTIGVASSLFDLMLKTTLDIFPSLRLDCGYDMLQQKS